jgi:hypothetical protein
MKSGLVTNAKVPVGAFEEMSGAICFLGKIKADDIYNLDSLMQHKAVTV